MNISFSQLPGIVNALHTERSEDRVWVAFDKKIQQLSTGDLHFFDSGLDALDFISFNKQQQKEVVRFPIEAALLFIEGEIKQALSKGEQNPTIRLDSDIIQSIHESTIYDWIATELTGSMDMFDWDKVFYDPLEANSEAESFDDKLQFNRLETLIESLSQFAQDTEKGKEFVRELITRHWSETPMEVQIADVLNGSFLPTHDQRIISSLNTNFMNMENLEFLQKNIKYTGFGETLFPELEKNIKEMKSDFQLHYSAQVNNRPFNATLQFRKSDTSEMYFFNRYTASIEKSNGEKLEQTFPINKGKGVTAKEAFNLLQGRAVKKDLTNAKGEDYHAWVQLDFDKKDEKNNQNYVMSKYNENYGYDLRETLGKFPIKELGGEKENDLMRSLERGNTQSVTFDNNGTDQKMFVEANPKFKTLNVYDEHFKLQKHESLPQVVKEGVAQGQENNGTKTTTKQSEKNTPVQKKDDKLLTKKRVRQGKGMKVG